MFEYFQNNNLVLKFIFFRCFHKWCFTLIRVLYLVYLWYSNKKEVELSIILHHLNNSMITQVTRSSSGIFESCNKGDNAQ